MSAPRYVSELQENAVWLSLSSLWAAGGIVAWLVSLMDSSGWNGSGSGLTMLALLVTATTLSLRLPILSSPPHTSTSGDHAVWFLTTLSAIHWLGFFALQARVWTDMLPALLLIGMAETWFVIRVREKGALPWLRASCSKIFQQLGKLGSEPHSGTAHTALPAHNARPLTLDPQLFEGGGFERKTVQGNDEQGRRYLSGEIKVTLAAEQTTETLSIAFSPPFAGEPDVDFECEGTTEDIHVQLIHSTPAGMRVGLKRALSPEPLTFALQWYATEVELSEVRGTPLNSEVLP